jgi:hypothetical protein
VLIQPPEAMAAVAMMKKIKIFLYLLLFLSKFMHPEKTGSKKSGKIIKKI